MGIYFPGCTAVLSVVFDGFGGGDSRPLVIGAGSARGEVDSPWLVPAQATVHHNGYKEADTWELEFDASRLPLHPDLIRSLAAQIYFFDRDGLDVDLGKYMRDTRNLMIAGLMDKGTLRYSLDGRRIVISGRDYTALLLGKMWDSSKSGNGGRIPVGDDLIDVIQALVDEAVGKNLHGGATLTVEYAGDGTTPANDTGHASPIGKNRKPAKSGRVSGHGRHGSKRGVAVKADQSYWDVIYRLCLSYGLICYVELNRVVVTTPKAVTEGSTLVYMAYGRNLKSLEVERNLGKEAVPQIKVVSYDPRDGSFIEARFPEQKDAVTTGVGTKRDEIEVYTAPDGIHEQGVLKEYAAALYHHKARSESKVTFSTKELKELDPRDVATAERGVATRSDRRIGADGRFLLTRLRPGDAVAIGFDAFLIDDEFRQLSEAERIGHLRRLGYTREVAELVARDYAKMAQFRRPFYVRSVSKEWSSQAGIGIDVEAVNFVSVKRDDAAA